MDGWVNVLLAGAGKNTVNAYDCEVRGYRSDTAVDCAVRVLLAGPHLDIYGGPHVRQDDLECFICHICVAVR